MAETELQAPLPRALPELPPALLSVVIPVYNLEHYIGDCLRSVLAQAHPDHIEVIVVDDGSTDTSAAQIGAVLAAFPGRRVQVITQPNAGVSVARNHGMAHARGAYLAFIDGDDLWPADFTARLIPILMAGEADMIEFNVDVIDDSGVSVDTITLVPDGAQGLHKVDDAILAEFVRIYQAFVWARVYRRSLWDGMQFPPGRHYEDNAAVPQLYLRSRSLHRLAVPLYRYRRRGGSITHAATVNTVCDLALNAQEALQRSGDAVHGDYWLNLFQKLFMHACSQAARVDQAAFKEALTVIDVLAQQHRSFLAHHGPRDHSPPLHGYTRRILVDRGIFRAKRAVKRLLGREMAARPALAPAAAEAGVVKPRMPGS